MRVDLCLNPKQFSPAQINEKIPALRNLLHRYNVREGYLFGSALLDSESCLSDLDIAVLPPLHQIHDWLSYYNGLHRDLCQLFQADNIDLVLLNKAPLPLQTRVVLDGLRILDVNGAATWEEGVLARHADLAAWRQENWDVTRKLVHLGAGNVKSFMKTGHDI